MRDKSKENGTMEYLQKSRLSQNQLKAVAAIAMLLDHVGAELFPEVILLRIIGRLAFPIFSYFIYEGFYYTRNRKRYFLRTFLLGLVCVAAYYLYSGEMYGNVLITFSLSMVVLYGLETGWRYGSGTGRFRLFGVVYTVLCIAAVLFINARFPVDYGLLGILLPAFAELAGVWNGKRNHRSSITGFAGGLLLLSVHMGGIQCFSLLAVPLLLAYNGRRGEADLKRFFYWFYPVHLAAIGSISMLI